MGHQESGARGRARAALAAVRSLSGEPCATLDLHCANTTMLQLKSVTLQHAFDLASVRVPGTIAVCSGNQQG